MNRRFDEELIDAMSKVVFNHLIHTDQLRITGYKLMNPKDGTHAQLTLLHVNDVIAMGMLHQETADNIRTEMLEDGDIKSMIELFVERGSKPESVIVREGENPIQ